MIFTPAILELLFPSAPYLARAVWWVLITRSSGLAAVGWDQVGGLEERCLCSSPAMEMVEGLACYLCQDSTRTDLLLDQMDLTLVLVGAEEEEEAEVVLVVDEEDEVDEESPIQTI